MIRDKTFLQMHFNDNCVLHLSNEILHDASHRVGWEGTEGSPMGIEHIAHAFDKSEGLEIVDETV